MHSEIEKLIALAIADGQITEKERNVILKKAVELGVDSNEVEMILDGTLHQLEGTKPKQKEKAGNIIKTCPACGAAVTSFSTQCTYCGHEFNNLKANSLVSQLALDLNKIEKDMTDYAKKLDDLWHNSELDDKINEAKAAKINTFSIPNTKEDILEFLTLSVPLASVKLSWFDRNVYRRGQQQLIIAWKAKAEQTIMKARFSMKDDKKTLDEIEYYAKQLGTK
jgi:hypothetical protein